MRQYLKPGSTIGVIGGGYESYLLLVQAHKMGFKTCLAVTNSEDEAINSADEYAVLDDFNYEDIRKVAENSDILMYQTLDIAGEDLEKIASEFPVIQGTELYTLSQDRYLERTFLDGLNINIAPFYLIVNEEDLTVGIQKVGFPSSLKPIQLENDHQMTIKSMDDVEVAKDLLQYGTYILEAYVEPEKCFSIMITKRVNGKIHTYPMTSNKYDEDDLVSSTVFIKNDPRVEEEIQRVSLEIAKTINYVGVLTVNFVMGENKTLYVQGISSNLSYAANIYELATGCSQFELQLRALANWPIPELFPLTNATFIRFFEKQREAALDLLQEKPQWKFLFHNESQDFSQENEIGYILISSTQEDFLINNVNSTNIWTID
ncbi:ATP-grasp domain-containing protein [Lactobacillus sp. YT155]|uniref:ATP-grasp domain-containing protein n=1 Tax=Lactobacillus sp. YT155 TaxID=3060955 RepID=UPI00265D6177|nr:ATP-grasp domain-containing protein [Lactobacillus sp. YT155]MDO1605217.1 ATP-grasp domain-containing protein [Lactobacillus sp. YT155]